MRNRLLLLLFFAGCARTPLKQISDAMRPSESVPSFVDTLSKKSFFTALYKHILVMENSKQVSDPMIFGQLKIEKIKYITALKKILQHEDDWIEWIRENYLFYEVYGQNKWGEVMSTGYYEPQIYGSLQKSNKFSQALYFTPNNTNENMKYLTREEIDTDNKLKGLNLEIAWLDPVDAFFMHIQGSGTLVLNNGQKMKVGYDNQNGCKYVAIGKFLTDIIPIEKMSMQKIRAYLETLNKNEQQNLFNKNPSYVFFKIIETSAITYAGMEVSDGRTIATDINFFPKGALAFLDIEEPQFETPDDLEPKSWLRKPRLVLDEDTGGAIRGGGRVDLYFGQGNSAAQKAGVMKQKGLLYYLIPKK